MLGTDDPEDRGSYRRGMRAVIVGAGIGGLAAALRLGRAGHDVLVVDRDPPPPVDVREAFGGWRRRSVRQWQQYHVFRARARRELARSVPDVLERLAEVGAAVSSRAARDTSAPGEVDGLFDGLAVRRPVLEWVLRREVEGCRRVHVLSSTGVTALSLDARPRCATGVRTTTGDEFAADLVVDAAGRRSPLRGWSVAAGFECPPADRVACGIAYYTRYYETFSGASAPRLLGGVEVTDDGFMAHALALGDARTIGAIFVVPASRSEFRALGSVGGWDAAVKQVPRMAEVLDPALRRAVMHPSAMYGLENAIVRWHSDGLHGLRRVAPIGDCWLVTNPNLAWGSSIALAHAFALADAVAEHGSDVDTAISVYHSRCVDEVEQLFEAACEADRTLQARWGLPSPGRRTRDLEREAVLFGLERLARRGDLDVGRRLARRANLLELPDALWHDEPLLAKARSSLTQRPYDPDRRAHALDQERFLAAIARAACDSNIGSGQKRMDRCGAVT